MHVTIDGPSRCKHPIPRRPTQDTSMFAQVTVGDFNASNMHQLRSLAFGFLVPDLGLVCILC
jgi:hypothetical protein